ncbi:MAG: hypothetical protein GY765_29510 [bacterium]|nr:hypothetical protein [bacterium]
MRQVEIESGGVRLSREEDHLYLEVNPGVARACTVTFQHALVISGMCRTFGQNLWIKNGKPAVGEPLVETISDTAYSLPVGPHRLDIFLGSEVQLVQVRADTREPLPLSWAHLSEIASVLALLVRGTVNPMEMYGDTGEAQKKWWQFWK